MPRIKEVMLEGWERWGGQLIDLKEVAAISTGVDTLGYHVEAHFKSGGSLKVNGLANSASAKKLQDELMEKMVAHLG